MTTPTSFLDRCTRAWWRITGRRVDLSGSESWLDTPTNSESLVGDNWIESAARAMVGEAAADDPDAGLLPRMSVLDGPGFTAADLHPSIRDFYEHTSRWRMEIWAEWNPFFAPFGKLIAKYFGRRVQQLTIPTSPLEVAYGLDSRVVRITDGMGEHDGSAWIRTLRSSGAVMYSGYYRATTLPGADRPSVHVTFPLESGNVQVFLRPTVLPNGELELRSPVGRFGTDGAYVLVTSRGRAWTARVALHEVFRLYVDDEGSLRTDHELKLWSTRFARLHYKLLARESSDHIASHSSRN